MKPAIALPHTLSRTVVIRAPRKAVFRFFTDSPRWASWWGSGSTIQPQAGGAVYIRHPNGIEAKGEVLELSAPERIVFSLGYPGNAQMPVGSSRVTIRLSEVGAGTRLDLTHEFAEAAPRDEHVQGWRFQLSLFANAVTDEVNAKGAELVDAWFDAWAEPDAAARERVLARIASSEVLFRDRYSNLDSLADLQAHIGASLRFMPGIRLRRAGDVRHCQGELLADWVATADDGKERGRGTNVFVLGPTSMIESVTGFAAPIAP
jgi:uncharacterized protein YndB with AHSA1/START domain